MHLTLKCSLCLFFLFISRNICHAQNEYDFVAGGKTIFEDNFSDDKVGRFPMHWLLYATEWQLDAKDNLKNYEHYPIKKQLIDDEDVLVIHSDHNYFPIAPKLDTTRYLPDTFTVEYDFRMDKEDCDHALNFYDSSGSSVCWTMFYGTGIIEGKTKTGSRFGNDFPVTFNCKAWHHFAVSYRKREVKYYVDQYCVAIVPDCGATPDNLVIAGDCYASEHPGVYYKNFRLATGSAGNVFNSILTNKKFTTHAIHFDVNESTITPESMSFIAKLAKWLEANPSVKLEIYGHTDSDGDKSANIILSTHRAAEVKKQLTGLGIDYHRLTTKGLGSGSPIKPNISPEDKAMNRRVEFISW